ncbi:unnamed protein product [Ambrosiozyma monospora]|uniref:Unnamed protein product n=1 Tax=Ambrosiozyma monospora TaxID=43982 RepID=A0ACB5TW30_AMBMO|nr:unnamed protein product [Ambrosiozyma monospora]
MTDSSSLVQSISSFEKALNSWAIIDLPTLQKQLDSNGLEIQANQKQSISSRKELASNTKLFKKLDQDEKLSQINKLLKQYQNEIDSLTKKNKMIENTFFAVYRAIAEAPDPKPLLTLSIDALSSLKEMDQLKKQNDALEEKLLHYADYDQLKVMLAKSEVDAKKVADARVKAKEDEFKTS